MTEEEKEAIEQFKKIIKQTEIANECGLSTNDFSEEIKTYNTILNLIQKKDKIIKLLVEECKNRHYNFCDKSEEEIIQYFKNKAENSSSINTIQEEK